MAAKREIWSFFSGGMGLDIGMENIGLESTLTLEIDRNCCETIRINRPALQVIEGSISDYTSKSLRTIRGFDGDVFLMHGGPPCQSFSPGGKRAGLNDTRGNLIYEYMRLIGDVRPQFFVLENVANLITAALRHRPISERPGKQWSLKAAGALYGSASSPALEPDEMSGSAIRQILLDFEVIGYKTTFGVVDAADFGAPQHRLRFVLLGSRDKAAPQLPAPTHGQSQPLQPYRTVRSAIEDLQSNPGAHSKYTPEVERFFNLVPAGGNWRSLPKELQEEAMGPSFNAGGGKTGFLRRLPWDKPSPTIIGRPNRKATALCHPVQTRPLSVRECARIQGFPDDWEFFGSMSAQYLQVGNAVPVQLGAAIGKTILLAQSSRSRARDSKNKSDEQLIAASARLRASARNKVVAKSKLNTLPLFSTE